ncbi:helix-turn-helix transcriptional regulator [Maricaulis sp.]|uniref:helix-turn-helix domain-containing protein n=1 Tax=Maricaulis sp. TaxID=1486257 RepID=UPI00261F2798|nr:helix-turn-helix transcriptional regulator [Maricaulis sp.]
MTLTILTLVFILTAYHTAVLAVMMALKPRLRPLGGLAAVFGTHMLANLAATTGALPAALDVTSAFGLLYGPLFYLFVRTLAFEDRPPAPMDLLHALPAIIIALWRPDPPISQIFGLPSLVIYISLAVRILFRHRIAAAQYRADDKNIDLGWVGYSVAGFAALAALDILRELVLGPVGWVSDDLALSAVLIAVTALLTAMGVFAWRHDKLQGAVPTKDTATEADRDDTEAIARFGTIDALVRERELWREPRLTLADLARETRLSAREVSRSINTGSGSSFSRYINLMRLDAINALMADPAHKRRTVIELAYEVGFNSKSAFNRIYREETGRTPSEVKRG